MREQKALRAAVIAEPDEDMPRLALADWLDENSPDEKASPADGASPRAAFIRIQCRLARGAYEDSDYAELLEHEVDLAEWLAVHEPEILTSRETITSSVAFEHGDWAGGEWARYRRGFPEVIDFNDYLDTAKETVKAIVKSLEEGFAESPGRTLKLEDALTDEIVLLARNPIFAELRGLYLDGLDDTTEDEAIAAISRSPHSRGLRRLHIDHVFLDEKSCKSLARSPHLNNLESLSIAYPISASSIESFGSSKWFRKLRSLHLGSALEDEGLRALAALRPMRNLSALTVSGSESTTPATMRRFASSKAFPSLADLNLGAYPGGASLSPDHVAMLAHGNWPLRRLRLQRNEVRKTGVEPLLAARFAKSLRVLELPWCEITASGIQELASADCLSGLRILNLEGNPIGPGGLSALARSQPLRGLCSLNLAQTNTPRGPLAARDVTRFLSQLETPRLRHLALSRLPVGIRGAQILATAPTFAGLTRLVLEGCSLGEVGTKHLVGSRTLSGLIHLDMSETKTGSGAGKLLNSRVLPRLATCKLGSGIPKGTATRLRRRAGILV